MLQSSATIARYLFVTCISIGVTGDYFVNSIIYQTHFVRVVHIILARDWPLTISIAFSCQDFDRSKAGRPPPSGVFVDLRPQTPPQRSLGECLLLRGRLIVYMAKTIAFKFDIFCSFAGFKTDRLLKLCVYSSSVLRRSDMSQFIKHFINSSLRTPSVSCFLWIVNTPAFEVTVSQWNYTFLFLAARLAIELSDWTIRTDEWWSCWNLNVAVGVRVVDLKVRVLVFLLIAVELSSCELLLLDFKPC